MGDLWILPESQRLESPNRNNGRRGVVPDVIVLHYAVDGDDFERGPDEDAPFRALSPSVDCWDVLRLFARPTRKASAHFVIGRDGSNGQGVALDDTAWHAGGGAFPRAGVGPIEAPRAGAMNRRSIGFELCNAGWAADRIGVPEDRIQAAGHPATPRRTQRWETYTDPQISTLLQLIAMARPHMAIDAPCWITGHEDAVNRDTLSAKTGRQVLGGKTDPGPAFPWDVVGPECRAMGITPVRYDFRAQAWVKRE